MRTTSAREARVFWALRATRPGAYEIPSWAITKVMRAAAATRRSIFLPSVRRVLERAGLLPPEAKP